MAQPLVTDLTSADPPPPELVEAGIYLDARGSLEHGLVVLAQGHPCWLVPLGHRWQLLVEPAVLPLAREQLDKFDRESLAWPPVSPLVQAHVGRADFFSPLLWVLITLVGFWAQGRWPALSVAGQMNAEAVFERGEVWRAFTALFLHADLGHLVSNLLGGFFLLVAVLSTLGRARGWWLLALASVVGNLLAAALHYPAPYWSLGASTGIFAGLGLLVGRQVREALRFTSTRNWRAVVIPVATGLAVLGLYGTGALRVDLVAHASGFSPGWRWALC